MSIDSKIKIKQTRIGDYKEFSELAEWIIKQKEKNRDGKILSNVEETGK